MEAMTEFGEGSDINRKVYLPLLDDMDECRRSSASLNELAYEAMLFVNPKQPQCLKIGYIANLVSEGSVSPCSLILGLLYIKRLSQINPAYLKSVSPRDAFLTALLIASKYMNDEGEDEALTNSQWAAAGYKEKDEIDQLERRFLSAIDWRLYVSMKEYYPFVAKVQERIAMSQLKQRGWATYTDLTTVWQASDVEETMLSASKQTAKLSYIQITCATSLVYLMCVATLFAASHGLHASYKASSDQTTHPHRPGSALPIHPTFHEGGVFGGLLSASNCSSTMCPLSQHLKSLVQEQAWGGSVGVPYVQPHPFRQPMSGGRADCRLEQPFLMERMRKEEMWNVTRSHYISAWKGTDYRVERWSENGGSEQGKNYAGMTLNKMNNSSDAMFVGTVGKAGTLSHRIGQGGTRLNLDPKWKHTEAGENVEARMKYNNIICTSCAVGNASNLDKTGTAIGTQWERAENQSAHSHCARSELLISTKALPWLQTTWLVA